MKVEFYEEFPSEENLKKLRLIKFSTKIFIAAKSIKEFQRFEKIAKSYKKDLEVAYWPIIPHSYWISPFSNTKDLIETFKELEKIKNCILIDLELPLRNKWMILKNSLSFFKNKKLIKKFMAKNCKRITTAEYPLSILTFFSKIIGLNYDVKTEKSIMWYSSMISKFLNEKIKKNLQKLKNKENYSIRLGTIATGILGDEPILSPESLKKDLKFVKESGFNKVIIFRLEGLNKKYIKILNKFV